MQDERDDVSFYHRTVRKTVGEALLQSKRYDQSQPLPERIRTLLVQLDERSAEGVPVAALRPCRPITVS